MRWHLNGTHILGAAKIQYQRASQGRHQELLRFPGYQEVQLLEGIERERERERGGREREEEKEVEAKRERMRGGQI